MRAGNWDEFVPRPAPLGRARREPGLRRHGPGHIGWKPCGFDPDPPQLGRAAARARRRPLRVGRLPRPRPAAGRARPEARLDRDGQRGEPAARLSRTGAARSASSGRRRSGCSASSRCCAGSATRRWATRGACRSTTARCRPRGSSRCSPSSSRAAAARARAIRAPAALEPRARAGLRRRRAVRGLELDRAADRGAPRRARLPEGRRRDLARRPDGDPRAARAPGPAGSAPSARARDRALLTSLERADRPHRGAARHALVALGVGQAARGAASSTRSPPRSTRRSLAGSRSARCRSAAAARRSATPATAPTGRRRASRRTRACFQVASGRLVPPGDRRRRVGPLPGHQQPRPVGRPVQPALPRPDRALGEGPHRAAAVLARGVEAAAELRIVCTPRP